jgi:hypothetical protein
LRAAYVLHRSFSLEASFSRANPRLLMLNPEAGVPFAPAARIDVNTYELEGLFGFGRGKVRGYVGLGAGAMTLDPRVPGIASGTDTQFAANIALGGKFFFNERLALRIDGRYRWRATEPESHPLVCGELGCYGFSRPIFSSSEVTGGLSYRFGEAPSGAVPENSARTLAEAPVTSIQRRFWSAAGEILLLELLPWTYDRYVEKYDYAIRSFDSVRNNFRNGFTFDRDDFNTNQATHPYHGSLFFNAARANGYGFWESGAFTLAGSFLWECCMENTTPSINDLVNTTIGGMTRGEIAHRLSVMVLDNTASGSGRFWRELGAAILNPAGAFTRLVHGEMSSDSANPDDRFPSLFSLSGDIGYRHVAGVPNPNQFFVSFSGFYGDPFAGEIKRPFDSFWAGVDINGPGGVAVSRFEERGILKGWELTDPSDRLRHVFGFTQEYEYFNNESQVFGAQAFGAQILSRYTIKEGLLAVTDVGAVAFPLAGIRTTNFANPTTGRNYDYAPGGGARIAARIFAAEREIVGVGYGVAWAHTVNGVSEKSTLQYFRATARLPIAGPVGVGGGYSWYRRKTTYSGFVEAAKTQSEWRVFVDFAFPHHWGGSSPTETP